MSKRVGRPPEVSHKTCEAILKEYVTGKPLGTPLPAEEVLARELRVSRGTVRSALKHLERTWMVLRIPFKGTVALSSWTRRRIRYGGGQVVMLSAQDHYVYPLENSFWRQVLHGAYDYYYPLKYDLVLSFLNLNHLSAMNERLENHLASPSMRGILLLGNQPEQVFQALKRIRLPVVSVDFDATHRAIDSITFENEKAGHLLGKKILAMGIGNVLVITEDPAKPAEKRDQAWQQRWDGIRKAFLARGRDPKAILVRERGHIFDQSNEAVLHYLKAEQGNEFQALVLPVAKEMSNWAKALAEIDRKVGSNFGLFGHGDAREENSMTGMRYDAHSLGYEAGKLLMSTILRQQGGRKAKSKSFLAAVPARFFMGTSHIADKPPNK